jgi:hypothetical protein
MKQEFVHSLMLSFTKCSVAEMSVRISLRHTGMFLAGIQQRRWLWACLNAAF